MWLELRLRRLEKNPYSYPSLDDNGPREAREPGSQIVRRLRAGPVPESIVKLLECIENADKSGKKVKR